jgi:metal-dependent amidase/aminoacylase/carboxypeptidase family protein
MKNNLEEFIKSKSLELFEKVKGYREYMHQHPELSFQEEKTMVFVANSLTKLNIPFTKGIGGTNQGT